MRRLDFSGADGPKWYSLLMDGLMGSNRGFKAPSETRVLSRILDKLEAIGTEGLRSGASTFGLPDGPTTRPPVDLKEAEYALVKEALESVPWRPVAVREATAMMEWFEEAQSSKDEEPAK